MKLSFSIEGRCLRHGVGTPTIKRRVGERERACVTEPYCIGEGERKVVVVVDFLVTICPCPVLAAAAPAFFFLSFFLPYAGVCKYVASSEGDCQMAAAV